MSSAVAFTREVVDKALPYVRSAGNDAALGLERLERLVAHLPREWFPAGGAVPRAAEALAGAAESLARTVESRRVVGRH
eukprot:scaffold64736_cov45-Prasinocladus_malaysianus.AAC.1